jgi:hypothetical protein
MYNIKSKSFVCIEAARLEAIEFIKKNCQEMPIICFGVDWPVDETFGLEKDAFIKIVNRNLDALENV